MLGSRYQQSNEEVEVHMGKNDVSSQTQAKRIRLIQALKFIFREIHTHNLGHKIEPKSAQTKWMARKELAATWNFEL